MWFERATLSRHTEGTEFPRSSRDRRSRSLTKGAKRLSSDMDAARLPLAVPQWRRRVGGVLRPALAGSVPWIVPPICLSVDGSCVPDYRVRRRRPRTTGASSLVALPDPGLCEDGSTTEYVAGRINVCERACSPPSRSRRSRLRTEAPRYRLLSGRGTPPTRMSFGCATVAVFRYASAGRSAGVGREFERGRPLAQRGRASPAREAS